MIMSHRQIMEDYSMNIPKKKAAKKKKQSA